MNKNKLPCIYVAQSATTRKFYVGQSKPGLTKRKADHKRDSLTRNDKFHSAIRELGWDDFFWEIKFVIEDVSDLDANQIKTTLSEKEKFYIKKYNSVENGYNELYAGSGAKGKYRTFKEKRDAYNKSRREKRAQMTEEEKQLRRKKRDEYRIRTNYKEKQKRRIEERKLNRTPEDILKRKEYNKAHQPYKSLKQKQRRAQMTEEEKMQYKLAKYQRQKQRRAQMTEEEKQLRKEQNRKKRVEQELANPQLRERRLAGYKQYKAKNKEAILAYQREYRRIHREELNEKRRKNRSK